MGLIDKVLCSNDNSTYSQWMWIVLYCSELGYFLDSMPHITSASVQLVFLQNRPHPSSVATTATIKTTTKASMMAARTLSSLSLKAHCLPIQTMRCWALLARRTTLPFSTSGLIVWRHCQWAPPRAAVMITVARHWAHHEGQTTVEHYHKVTSNYTLILQFEGTQTLIWFCIVKANNVSADE